MELAKLRFDLGPISAAKEMISRAAELTKRDSQNKGNVFATPVPILLIELYCF